jgi:hypothetical protein
MTEYLCTECRDTTWDHEFHVVKNLETVFNIDKDIAAIAAWKADMEFGLSFKESYVYES